LTKRYVAHLKRELRHKWYVFVECWKAGIPWRGLTHDLSKFTPIEFGPYARHYYTTEGRQLPRGREGKREYLYAVLHHYNNNKHHPDYWILGDGPMPIPSPHREEMLCDWLGYTATNGVPAKDYYIHLKREGQVHLHPETQEWVEEQLGIQERS